jgi:hypothetical protein
MRQNNTVIKDFKNSKLIKALINRDGSLIRGKRQVLNKVLNLQEALLKNKPGESIHGRTLQRPNNFNKTSYRSASVRVDSKVNNKAKKANMSMTAYATGFGNKADNIKNKMNMSQNIPKGAELRLKTAHPTTFLYNPREGKRVGTTKYGPNKVRPFLDYDFSHFQKPEPESAKTIDPPKQEIVKGAKAGTKIEADTETIKAKTQNIRNILFEKDIEEDESDTNSPKFKQNNIYQEEIEAKMFENPAQKRPKVNSCA